MYGARGVGKSSVAELDGEEYDSFSSRHHQSINKPPQEARSSTSRDFKGRLGCCSRGHNAQS